MGKKKKKEKITLTKDQKKAVKECEAYINGTKYKNSKYITISGIGGSGKTFAAKYIIEKFPELSVLGIAISHAAVGQLELGLEEECITLAKALNKKPVLDKKTGKKEFKIVASFFDPPPIKDYDLLVIDECSMISKQEEKEILEYAKEDAKIIYLGDIAQLPAIDGDDPVSITFKETISELSEVMRFKEPLTKVNLQYRNHILDYINEGSPLNRDVLKFKDDVRGLYNINTKEGLIEAYISNYDPDNISKCRIVAYRNKTIDDYNNIIRKRLLGSNSEQILKGDLIITNAPYRKGIIRNNEFLKVVSVQKANLSGIRCFLVDLENEQKARITDVRILDEKDYKGFYIELDKFKKKKQWKKFYDLKDSFLNYGFSHSVNSHKTQGSTVDYVFVDQVDILSVVMNSELEKFQSSYVAISRAAKRIYIYNPLIKK